MGRKADSPMPQRVFLLWFATVCWLLLLCRAGGSITHSGSLHTCHGANRRSASLLQVLRRNTKRLINPASERSGEEELKSRQSEITRICVGIAQREVGK